VTSRPGVKTSVYIPRDLADRLKASPYSHTVALAAGLDALESGAPVTVAVLRGELAKLIDHMDARERKPVPAQWPAVPPRDRGRREPYRRPAAGSAGTGGRQSPERRGSIPVPEFSSPEIRDAFRNRPG
jgi:hypothetical protein